MAVVNRLRRTIAISCWLAALGMLPASAAVDQEASLSAARKFQRIMAGEVPSGESVSISHDEMNAFLRHHAGPTIPDGIREQKLTFRKGGALIEAQVDLETASASSEDLPLLMRLLLRGTRTIVVDVDFAGQDGQGAAQVVSIAIDEVELSGTVLEWFFESFAPPDLRPYLVGGKTELPEGVREIRLEPGRAVVVAE